MPFQEFWVCVGALCHMLKDLGLRMTGLEQPVFLMPISLKPIKDNGDVPNGGVCIYWL